MSVVIELHPEDLLDREWDDELSAAEQSRLDAHLERCPTCRLLRQAKADFAAERDAAPVSSGRLGRLAPTLLQALEQQALEAEETGAPAPGTTAKTAWRWLPLGGRTRRMVLAAAVVLTSATAAAASGWLDLGWAGALGSWQAPPAPTSRWAAVAEQVAPVAASPRRPPAEPAPPPEEPATEPEPSAQPAEASPRQPPVIALSEAVRLFDRAATARTRGDYDQALTLYRELQRRFPGSDEARTSRAIVARLLLDTGDAEAALTDYEEYLTDGGAPLTEEAMVGQARAYQRLGRTDDERAAWTALLQRFPKSMHAAVARERLRALAVTEPE